MDETTRMLEMLNATFPPVASMSALDGRAAVDARIRTPTNIDDAASAVDRVVENATHGIPIRMYQPHDARDRAPVTVYAHGGGFLHGSIAGHDGFCRRWTKGTGGAVISIDYRLAPDWGPGAGRDDVVDVADWAVHAGLAENGLVLAGDSSGGNVAAGAAITLRDRGASPVIGQVLLYPFLDPTMSSDSYRTRASGYFVTAELLAHYWRTFLGDQSERFDADVTPLAVHDLAGLPPAIVVTAGLDPLADEGVHFARLLRDSGVRVVHRHHPDQFHGFLTIPGYGPGISAADILWSDVRSLTSTDPKDER